MFKYLIGLTPEKRATRICAEILSSYQRSLFDSLRQFEGVDSFVANELSSRKLSASKNTRRYLARELALAVSDQGDSIVVKNAGYSADSVGSGESTEYIVAHEYSWTYPFAEKVLSQCWGKLGRERKSWMMLDDQHATDKFGIDSKFREMFVLSKHPLYTIAAEVSSPFEGVVYQKIN